MPKKSLLNEYHACVKFAADGTIISQYGVTAVANTAAGVYVVTLLQAINKNERAIFVALGSTTGIAAGDNLVSKVVSTLETDTQFVLEFVGAGDTNLSAHCFVGVYRTRVGG